jgi:hypothetical protein
VKVYRRAEDAFERAAELTAERGDVLTTPLLPGWSAPLADMFVSPV